jgi:ABC-type Zn uptake system ZnuABC Zn-binding protein ZnuA
MRLSPIFAVFARLTLIAGKGLSRLALPTSFAPIHSPALNVAGDAADVSVLIPPATGPHDRHVCFHLPTSDGYSGDSEVHRLGPAD